MGEASDGGAKRQRCATISADRSPEKLDHHRSGRSSRTPKVPESSVARTNVNEGFFINVHEFAQRSTGYASVRGSA